MALEQKGRRHHEGALTPKAVAARHVAGLVNFDITQTSKVFNNYSLVFNKHALIPLLAYF
ncbi:hypothetical protein SCFA_1600003 [anaerobic digester metagenome]|uniref:Uncharacterized protein n=1 Tax=anaerobic digester metagenome TaxID=1263854 RepID=A0A485LX17_9ZZZZ